MIPAPSKPPLPIPSGKAAEIRFAATMSPCSSPAPRPPLDRAPPTNSASPPAGTTTAARPRRQPAETHEWFPAGRRHPRRRPGSLLTRCWRKMDSNFQYAGAVSLGCRPFSRARLRGRAGAVGAGYRGSARLSGELPKRSTVIPNHGWIAWPNSCARRGRARAAAGSASLRTRSKHWRRRWPSGRRSG